MKIIRLMPAVVALIINANAAVAADRIYGVEISPSGKHYAVLRDFGQQQALAIYSTDDPAAAPKGIGLGPVKAQDLEWGGDDYVLVRFAGEKGGIDTVSGVKTLEFQRWMSISRDTGASKTLFGNEEGADFYYFIASAGVLLAAMPLDNERALFARSFPQVSLQSGSRLKDGQDQLLYSLQSANLKTGDIKRVADGDKKTIDWIVDAAGKAVARIDQYEASKKVEIMAADESGKRFRKAGEISGDQVKAEEISFLGVGAAPRSIQVLRTEGGSRTLTEYDLDTASFKAGGEAVGAVNRVIYDPREARARILYVASGGGERPVHVDPADQKTQAALEKAVAGSAISIVSKSVDGGRMIARADFAGKGSEFYLYDKGAKRLELVAAND
ncbi:MAG: hypothetical protein ACK4NP_13590 [Parvularculaceae bacterium]